MPISLPLYFAPPASPLSQAFTPQAFLCPTPPTAYPQFKPELA
jgi:hypothetical protein